MIRGHRPPLDGPPAWWLRHCVYAFAPDTAGDRFDKSLKPCLHGTLDASSSDVRWRAMGPAGLGPCLEFDGDATNDRLDLGSTSSSVRLSLADLVNCTIYFDVYYDGESASASGAPRIIDKSNDGNGRWGWGVWLLDNSDLIRFYVGSGGTSVDTARAFDHSFGGSIPAGRYRMAFCRRGDGSTGEWWRDGAIVTTFSGKTTDAFDNRTTNAALGNWNHTTNRQWAGEIHRIYVFDAALPRGAIKALFAYPDMWRLAQPAFRPVLVPAGGATPARGGLTLLGVGA